MRLHRLIGTMLLSGTRGVSRSTDHPTKKTSHVHVSRTGVPEGSGQETREENGQPNGVNRGTTTRSEGARKIRPDTQRKRKGGGVGVRCPVAHCYVFSTRKHSVSTTHAQAHPRCWRGWSVKVGSSRSIFGQPLPARPPSWALSPSETWPRQDPVPDVRVQNDPAMDHAVQEIRKARSPRST